MSGPPVARSSAPAGGGRRRPDRPVATGGRGRTRVPLRPAVSTTPRWRRAWYALATVPALTPRPSASTRTGGSGVPGSSAPVRTPDSTLAEISTAVVPTI